MPGKSWSSYTTHLFREHDLKRMRRGMLDVLNTLAKIIKEYGSIYTNNFKKLMFSFNELKELPKLRQDLVIHEQHLQTYIATLQCGGTRRLEDASKRQEQQLASMREILYELRALKNKDSENVTAIASNPSHESEELLKMKLVDNGVSNEDIQSNWNFIKEYLEAGKAKQKNLESLFNSQLPNGMRASILVEPNLAQSNSPQPADISALHKSNSDSHLGRSENLALPRSRSTEKYTPLAAQELSSRNIRDGPRLKQNPFRILCVDGNNTFRSVIAQAYLELIRTWTANTNGQWLFKEADSAGCWVESEFTKTHKDQILQPLEVPKTDPENKGLKAIAARTHYGSREKDEILERLQKRTTRGIGDKYFQYWDYILCFDESTERLLYTLKACAAKTMSAGASQKADIVRLPGTQWRVCGKIEDTIELIKLAVKSWLRKDVGWMEPPRGQNIKRGLYRSREFVVWEKNIGAVLGKGGSKIEDIRTRSKCEIRITDARHLQGRLVSITGPQDALPKAEALIRECYAR